MRQYFRNRFLRLFCRALRTDEVKQVLSESQQSLSRHPAIPDDFANQASSYRDLGTDKTRLTSQRDDIVFITARFRTGSTLLWRILRNLSNCTTYYEPLNERRWFDPRRRGDRVDATHSGVTDYWCEYEGLQSLNDLYREEWISKNLLMDGQSWDSDLKQYLTALVSHASQRPILQFNRIDFRLAWLRHEFPKARILQLIRHPRDVWCSTLGDASCFSHEGRMRDFGPYDKFYLTAWCEDLKYHFPFLNDAREEHPYQSFYFLWKLSYLFGQRYADFSVRYEQLVQEPVDTIGDILQRLGIQGDARQLSAMVRQEEALGKWQSCADDTWFLKQEARCESILSEFLGVTSATSYKAMSVA